MKKWFFIALMLANLAVFAWGWQEQEVRRLSNVGEGADLVAQDPQLVLLRELAAPLPPRPQSLPETFLVESGTESEPETPLIAGSTPLAEIGNEFGPTVAIVEETAPPHGARCLRLGSFESKSGLTDTMRALQQGGVEVRNQGDEVSESKRFRVLVPPAPSAAAATRTLERLQRAGVRDFYLIRSGDNKNAISLGVYSSNEQAQRRVVQIRETKITTRIEEISLPTKRWWLEFEWADDESWRALLPLTMREISPVACH